MTSRSLSYILRFIDLDKCTEEIENQIYYIKKKVKIHQRYRGEYEFLILVRGKEKQGIILRCDDVDLHWYVYKKHRGKQVLSNALRTGIIKKKWPKNIKITMCLEENDDVLKKREMTKHLAELAGLILED